ncbi:ADP-ribosylation factor-like protein 6-interacting protein 4 isoform X1 [Octopus sinensis]|uniref:ADP-ribosylation factor-like protein 6-interacting protein 4 n=1 Tax=Octopus sinensis TaxID=2607531 RepID=A0A6P7SMY4_9MOLL|nr:ADP-ribosylation factor-like protein 6-interacting protein 4 isoform X1 [Octopus sinensis]
MMSSTSKRSSRSRSPSTRNWDSPKSNKHKTPRHDSKIGSHHFSKKHRTSHDDSEEKSTSGRSSSKKLSKHPKSPPDRILKRKRSSSRSSSCSSDVGNFKRSKKSSKKSSHHDSSEQKKKHKKHKKEKKKKKKKKKHKKLDKSSADEKVSTGKEDVHSPLKTTEKVTSLQPASKVKESMTNEDTLSAPGPSPRILKPMTKEEWEKQQSVIRRVYDPTTGRNRLVKGDGEILEEIVSKERHQQINKQATVGDGLYYQSKMGLQK